MCMRPGALTPFDPLLLDYFCHAVCHWQIKLWKLQKLNDASQPMCLLPDSGRVYLPRHALPGMTSDCVGLSIRRTIQAQLRCHKVAKRMKGLD